MSTVYMKSKRNNKTKQNQTKTTEHVKMGLLPIDGDLKGYLSGRSTRTFHTPPSYGAAQREWTRNIKRDSAEHSG